MSDFRFSCPACNRSFAWKPELAGRQAKCQCGHGMTVPAQPPQDLVELAPMQMEAPPKPATQKAAPPRPAVQKTGSDDPRAGRKPAAETNAPKPTPATPAAAKAPTRQPSVPPPYPMSQRPRQEEAPVSTAKYVVLGGILLLVAMGMGGWIIYKGTGGADANKPKLGDDAEVARMIEDEYPKDLTEWIEANSSRMLGGMNAMQAASLERSLKKKGATKVLAFGAGILCLCIAVELPDDPAQRRELFDWHRQNLLSSDPSGKDVGQRWILHNVGL